MGIAVLRDKGILSFFHLEIAPVPGDKPPVIGWKKVGLAVDNHIEDFLRRDVCNHGRFALTRSTTP